MEDRMNEMVQGFGIRQATIKPGRIALYSWLLTIGYGLSAFGFAQPVAQFLGDAYKKDIAYLEAERSLSAAQDELKKVQTDPEAAQLTLARAQESAAVAQAKLAQSRDEANAKALDAYGGVLLAGLDVNLAQRRKELSALQLQAADLRFKAGAISASDLAKVKEQDAQATSAVRTAVRALAQAQARLKPYGEIKVQALPEPGAVDPEKFSIKSNARLQEVAQQTREAERALALSSGPDTAPLDKAARERDLARARATLGDVERNLNDALDGAQRRYQTALDNYKIAQGSQARTASELEAAKKRFATGAIAQVVLKQSELAKEEADRNALAAQLEVWNAIYGLQVAGGTN
jgi:outer membrane protein TolC